MKITDSQMHHHDPLHHLSLYCIINLERFADKSDRITTEQQMVDRVDQLWAIVMNEVREHAKRNEIYKNRLFQRKQPSLVCYSAMQEFFCINVLVWLGTYNIMLLKSQLLF